MTKSDTSNAGKGDVARSETDQTVAKLRAEFRGHLSERILADDWSRLWNEKLVRYIRPSQLGTSPDLTLLAAIDGRLQFQPYPSMLRRRVRRLFALLELEYVVEQRNFADYRTRWEQEIEGLGREAVDALAGIVGAQSELTKLAKEIRDGLNSKIDNWIGQIAAGKEPEFRMTIQEAKVDCLQGANTTLESAVSALANVESQANVLKQAAEERYRLALFERLRPIFGEVDRGWGTWQRRIKWPTAWFAITTVFVILLYSAIVFKFPFEGMFWALLGLPVLAGGVVYYLGRMFAAGPLNRLKKEFAPLNPDDEDKGVFWRAEGATVTVGFTPEPTSRPPSYVRPLKWSLALSGLVFLFLGVHWMRVINSEAALRFALISSDTTQGPCKAMSGRIAWAGPGGYIVLDDANGVRFAARSAVSLIESADHSIYPDCGRRSSDSSISASRTIYLPNGNDVRSGDRIIVPFFERETPTCNSQAGAELSEDTKKSLRYIGDGFRACSTPAKPVIVDVMGFASSVKFRNCPRESDQLNHDLAELRRTKVIGALTSASGKDAKDAVGDFVIEPQVATRWANFDEMEANRKFTDKMEGPPKRRLEVLSRHVAIEVKSAGICADK